jgi:hypothetical protein
MALTSTTAFASSGGHSSHGSTKVTTKGSGNCTVVNSKNVTCNVSKHSHGHGGDNGHGRGHGRHDVGLGAGLEDVVSGVGDILNGLL